MCEVGNGAERKNDVPSAPPLEAKDLAEGAMLLEAGPNKARLLEDSDRCGVPWRCRRRHARNTLLSEGPVRARASGLGAIALVLPALFDAVADLGRDPDALTPALEPASDPLLGGAVAPGRVEELDPELERAVEQTEHVPLREVPAEVAGAAGGAEVPAPTPRPAAPPAAEINLGGVVGPVLLKRYGPWVAALAVVAVIIWVLVRR